VAEPKNPALPKMREWPMFRIASQKRPRSKTSALEGRPLPTIADLVMEHVPGTPLEKLAWLRQQSVDGKLDGDDPEEIEQAEALLTMLARMAAGKGSSRTHHLEDLLDEGLKQTFPASDPVSVGDFTSTEAPRRPIDRAAADFATLRNPKRPRTSGRARRVA
jgi:hypothetical protein